MAISCAVCPGRMSENANEAEVFMLMGCRELCKMKVSDAIVEGDSLLAIQWVSRKSKCPWSQANWVKEVHHISSQLNCSFQHILREANDAADQLAEVGVSI